MHDSHIHLNLKPLSDNLTEIISNFAKAGGTHILTQSTDLLDISETLDIANKYPEIIDVALGLHPTCFEEYTLLKGKTTEIYEFSQKYIADWENQFEKEKEHITAIGETGIDYYQFSIDQRYSKDIISELKEIQKLSFTRHIQNAIKYDLPMSIHSRDLIGKDDSVQDTLRLLAEIGKGQVRGSFHSYTGNVKFLNDILDLGLYIGFNAIITYKSGENVREILKLVPEDRILFETDGPFLPPQSVRRNKDMKEKFAQPADIREIMEVAAQVKGVTVSKLEVVTDENYKKLFL